MNGVAIAIAAIALCRLAGAQEPEITPMDRDTSDFVSYVSGVTVLDGMFRSVVNFCIPYVSSSMLSRTEKAWKQANGRYIDSVDLATRRFVATKVEQGRRASVTEDFKLEVARWHQEAMESNRLLDALQADDLKDIACARMLGSLASESFQLERMQPALHRYWTQNLQTTARGSSASTH